MNNAKFFMVEYIARRDSQHCVRWNDDVLIANYLSEADSNYCDADRKTTALAYGITHKLSFFRIFKLSGVDYLVAKLLFNNLDVYEISDNSAYSKSRKGSK